MFQLVEGNYLAKGKRFGIVAARFNEFLTDKLLESAVDTLIRHGAHPRHIEVVRTPGSFEIPLAVRKLLTKRSHDCLITLGVLIRGETRHFQQVSDQVAARISELSLQSEIPIIFSVLSCENLKDAIERCGSKQGNKGREAALAAIEMANLMRKI